MRGRLDQSSDEGSALVICLFLMMIAGFFILPIMSYTMSVLRSNVVVKDKATRSEAVRGGLRVALSDPTKLYAACKGAGPTGAVDLAPPPSVNSKLPSMTTQCFKVGENKQFGDALRWALTTTQTGSQLVIPPPDTDGSISPVWCTSKANLPPLQPIPCGTSYPGNGSPITTDWWQSANAIRRAQPARSLFPISPPTTWTSNQRRASTCRPGTPAGRATSSSPVHTRTMS